MAFHDEERNETYLTLEEELDQLQDWDAEEYREWKARNDAEREEFDEARRRVFYEAPEDFPWTVLMAYYVGDVPSTIGYTLNAPSRDLAILMARRELEQALFEGERYHLFPLEEVHSFFIIPGHVDAASFERKGF